MKNLKMMALIGLLVAGFSATAQDSSARMLHVNVQNSQNSQENISINLPVGFLKSMAPMVQQHINQAFEDGSVQDELNQHGVDLQAMWQSIRDNGPMNLVDISQNDSKISVRTTETHLVVNIDENGEGTARMEMPIEVLDALFGEDGQINVDRLVAVLDELETQDLFNMTSENETVRVWID